MRFLLISAALALAPPAWADPGEGAPDRASALTDAQAAWSDYRARECGYRVARWGEGSGARVVLASCMAQMSADRAVDLIAYEQEEEGSLALRRE